MNQHVAIEADPLIRYGIHTNDEWASFVLLRIFKELPYKPHAELDSEAYETLVRKNLQGYVLVIDPKFDSSAQYKLPSGKKSKVQDNEYQPDETPLCTAIRELHGETGVRLPANRFTFIGKTLAKTRHGDHWKCLFTANGHHR